MRHPTRRRVHRGTRLILTALVLLASVFVTSSPSVSADPPLPGSFWTTYPVPDYNVRNLGEIPPSHPFTSLNNIAQAFNNARGVENGDICPAGVCEPNGVLMQANFSFPAGYAGWTPSKKALHILNAERAARGLSTFADTHPAVEDVAQAWAKHLADNNLFQHRANVAAAIQASPQCGGCAGQLGQGTENLYASYGSGDATYAVEEAIYLWMYQDRTLGGQIQDQQWGHRNALLWNDWSIVDDWGAPGVEGFIGMGVAVNGTTVVASIPVGDPS